MSLKLICFLLIKLLLFDDIRGYCPNFCNYNGYCGEHDKCYCFNGKNGLPAWTGHDCSLRTCPSDVAWIGSVQGANDVHPIMECSNRGLCNRNTGLCTCYDNFEGLACERTACPSDCNNFGVCMSQRQLADEAGMIYNTPWDADKHYGCLCDIGRRGPDCLQIECPSGPDILHGHGNEAGRDCSGRGLCDYDRGVCQCFTGYHGSMCQFQVLSLLSVFLPLE